MFLFFIFASLAYSDSFVLRHRFSQAQDHIRLNQTLPFNPTQLAAYSGYSAVGWTKPGKYPTPDQDSVWLNQVPTGDYKVQPTKEKICYQRNISYAFTMICLTPVASSFWWGESINISSRIVCITETYRFSLTSPAIGLSRATRTNLNEDDLQVFPDLSIPPAPWKLHNQIQSKLVLNGTIRGLRSGFFWFKPLYWASFYAGHRITLDKSETTSRSFQVLHLHPVSRNSQIEGLFGFEPSHEIVEAYLDPITFEFYPSD